MAQWRMVERQDQLMGLLPQNYHIVQLPGWEGNHGARDAFRFLQTKAGFDPKEVLVVEELPINGSSRG